MSVKISRKTGWLGSGTRIQVKINGEKVAKVSEGQSIEVDLPNEKAYLRASQSGVKSNGMEVDNGDHIEIKQTWWYRWSFPALVVCLFLTTLLPALKDELFATLFIGILFVSSMFFLNGFSLHIIDRNYNSEESVRKN